MVVGCMAMGYLSNRPLWTDRLTPSDVVDALDIDSDVIKVIGPVLLELDSGNWAAVCLSPGAKTNPTGVL